MTPSPLAGPLLQACFADHLLQHRRASPETVRAYRDTFRLLLNHCHRTAQSPPSGLRLSQLNADAILSFLDALERERGNCARSRNARLAAIRSFFRFVALREPVCVAIAARVLAIPVKRTDRHIVGFLTRPEIDAILEAPDASSRSGRRDRALLLTLYNTGARVSEIARIQRRQFEFGSSSFICLNGKGRKERTVPLWGRTASVLRTWFREIPTVPGDLAFPSARGEPLSRHGVTYILRRAVHHATSRCPTLKGRTVSPHVIRHTTAMHLLQSGVDTAVIALWLGHESIETTHMYIEADLATRERALASLAPAGPKTRRFHADDALMAFLASL